MQLVAEPHEVCMWVIESLYMFGVCSCYAGVCLAACSWSIIVDVLPVTTNEICLRWLGMSCTVYTKQIACEALAQARKEKKGSRFSAIITGASQGGSPEL